MANLLQFAPDETIQAVLSIPNYEVAKYLVLATRSGKVKKTSLAEYDSPRQGGLIAVRLAADPESGEPTDELIGAALCNPEDDIILVSKHGMSLKFRADDEQLRPMGRQTAGVQGMKFRDGDELLSMDVIWGDSDRICSWSPTRASPSARPSANIVCKAVTASVSRPCNWRKAAAHLSVRSWSAKTTRSWPS